MKQDINIAYSQANIFNPFNQAIDISHGLFGTIARPVAKFQTPSLPVVNEEPIPPKKEVKTDSKFNNIYRKKQKNPVVSQKPSPQIYTICPGCRWPDKLDLVEGCPTCYYNFRYIRYVR